MSDTETAPAIDPAVAELIEQHDEEMARYERGGGDPLPSAQENRAFLEKVGRDKAQELPTLAELAEPLPPGDELNVLLKEFERGIKRSERGEAEEPPPPVAEQPWTADQIERKRAELKQTAEQSNFVLQHYSRLRQEHQAARDKADVGDVVGYLKKANPALSELSDADLEAHLVRAGNADPVVADAWANRYTDDGKWEQALSKLVRAVGAATEPTIARLRQAKQHDDTARALASVRNLDTSPRPAPTHDTAKLMKMSDREYENFKASIGLGRGDRP